MDDGLPLHHGLPSLKEADAFQRLVCSQYRRYVEYNHASKKQTPFSVWYGMDGAMYIRGTNASKKQTPFSVWYENGSREK